MTTDHRRTDHRCLRSVGLRSSPFFTATLLLTAPLQAQDLAEGKKLYDVQCQACHGEDAHGSDRAPELAGSRRLRSRSTAQIREIIRKGIPEGGMPAFDLAAPQLDAPLRDERLDLALHVVHAIE